MYGLPDSDSLVRRKGKKLQKKITQRKQKLARKKETEKMSHRVLVMDSIVHHVLKLIIGADELDFTRTRTHTHTHTFKLSSVDAALEFNCLASSRTSVDLIATLHRQENRPAAGSYSRRLSGWKCVCVCVCVAWEKVQWLHKSSIKAN